MRIERFLKTLDVAAQEDDEDFIETFERLGCHQCHRNDLPIEGSRQPLTNLLLHDVGTGHFESGHPQNAYRTPPPEVGFSRHTFTMVERHRRRRRQRTWTRG